MARVRSIALGAALLLSPPAGGGSAPPPVRLGVSGADNSNASIAAAGRRVVVTWAARSASATDVYAATSQDGGSTFDPPVRVNDVAGDARVSGEQAPRVALGRGIQVVWGSRRDGTSSVRTASAAAGSVFKPAHTVHAEALAGARGWASLAVDAQGASHIAWLDGRGDGATRPAAAHHGMRQDLYQAVLRSDGTRDEVRIAADVCFCCKTAMAADAGSAVYVAWRHIYPPSLRDIAVARSSDGGRSFGAPVRVSQDGWAIDGCPDDGPAIAVDAGGVVHVVWPTWVSGDDAKGVFYSYSADAGRTFAPRVRVDAAKGGAAHPQLAVAGDRVVVVWDEAGSGTRRVRLREIARDASGRAWAPRPGSSAVLGGEGQATYPSVAASGDGVVVAWTEEAATGSQICVERLAR